MELVVKDLNEVNQFMEAVKPLVLKADISKNNINVANEISGEIVLGDEDSQIKIYVTNGNQSENKYDSFTKGKKFTKDLNDSITNSPDLSNQVSANDKPEKIIYFNDYDKHFKEYQKFLKELIDNAFDIDQDELDRDN